jgi:hypothetical protein
MARQFSIPEVATLKEGESCGTSLPASEVKRKVALYAARNNKRFTVQRIGDYCRITREAVTDSELPGA